MRRRNNTKKVVPLNISPEDLAAQKIQALFRGRKSRISSTNTKLKAISHVLFELRMRVSNLEKKNISVSDVTPHSISSHNSNIFGNIVDDSVQKIQDDIINNNDHHESSDNNNYDIGRQGTMPLREMIRQSSVIVDTNSEIDHSYTLSTSMWDVVLLLGTKPVGDAGSIYSSLLLLINVLVQFVFVFIVLTNFTQVSFSDDVILGFRSWRRNIAQSSNFMEGITEVSLASRICNNDSGLELSGNQAVAHELLGNYITGKGSLMCILTIIMWLLTVAKEVSSVISFFQAVNSLSQGNKTVINMEGNGIQILCKKRYVMVIAITACRFLVVLSLGYAGAAWLANTVSVTDLILNAVALEFVLCVDEIIFEALAPLRLKTVIDSFSPLPLPKAREYKGVDAKSFSLFAILTFFILLMWGLWVVPFENRLKLADDALCAGELDFVYTIGGSGVPAWSKTQPYRDGSGKEGKAKSYGTGDWSQEGSQVHVKDAKTLNFVKGVIDSLIDGYANIDVTGNYTCGEPILFYRENQTVNSPYCEHGALCISTFCEAQYFVGLVDIYGVEVKPFNEVSIKCCLAQQMRTPNIKGGRLSLYAFEDETVATATDLYNAACTDQLGPQTPYEDDQDPLIVTFYNLIAGSLSDSLGGNCGLCPAHTPFCDPDLNECRNITCNDVIDYCLEDSTEGVKARQFCPITCNCHNPSDKLVLSGSSFGCPANCGDYLYYDFAVSNLECADKVAGSAALNEYVDEVTRVSSNWPGFWKDQWLTTVGPYIKGYGCVALIDLMYNPGLPQDLCRFGGTMWPIKPMTTLCPVTCGCTYEMKWGCPTNCSLGDF